MVLSALGRRWWPAGEEQQAGSVDISSKTQDLLATACRTWSAALGQQQESNGGFRGMPYGWHGAGAYDTGQALSGLLPSAQTGYGMFDEERQRRAIRALQQYTLHWKRDVVLAESYQEAEEAFFIEGKGEEPALTIGVAWATIAFSRYWTWTKDIESRDHARRLQNIILGAQLDDGSFQFAADPDNTNQPSAYATTLALWALVESDRLLLDPSERQDLSAARRRSANWIRQSLADELPYSEHTTSRTVAGLAEQATWVLCRARAIGDDSEVSQQEQHLLGMIADDIIQRCSMQDLSTHVCVTGADLNGVIPKGRGARGHVFVMFWRPWAMLASYRLMKDRRAPLDGRVRLSLKWAIESLVQQMCGDNGLVIAAQARTSRFEVAEHLFAVSEILGTLIGGPKDPR